MPSFDFGRERRIRRRADFLRVQAGGERVAARHFVLLVLAHPAAQEGTASSFPSRLGVVAAKKVGGATVRNRIKRLCRECFRTWPGFVPDGIDLVVIAREGAGELSLTEVRSEWATARPLLLKRCAKVLAAVRPA